MSRRALSWTAAAFLAALAPAAWFYLRNRPRPFEGRHGYTLSVPPGYAALSVFRDPGKRHELAFFCPKGTRKDQLGREELFGSLGILRLEVSPRLQSLPDGRQARLSLAFMRERIAQALGARKERFETSDLAASMPAFLLSIREPPGLCQAVLEGKDFMYILTAGKDDARFRLVLGTLRDKR